MSEELDDKLKTAKVLLDAIESGDALEAENAALRARVAALGGEIAACRKEAEIQDETHLTLLAWIASTLDGANGLVQRAAGLRTERDRLQEKLAAAESACREGIDGLVDIMRMAESGKTGGPVVDKAYAVQDKLFRLVMSLKSDRAVLAGEGEARTDEDKADLADAREALKEPGEPVPWDDVKKRLGLDPAARGPGREGGTP